MSTGSAVELVITGDLAGGRTFVGSVTVEVSSRDGQVTATGSATGPRIAAPPTSTTWSDIKKRTGDATNQ